MSDPPNGASDELDEASIVTRVLDGDVDAFEAIVLRWQAPLVSMAHRFCRDPGIAEDLAQEALVKVFRSLGRWRREAKFSTWMFAVALNHYRSAVRRHIPPGVDLDRIAHAAGDRRDEEDRRLRDEAVRAAVATLPPRYRDVVVLYYLRECDLAETARIAQLREGTVKARLFRGRELLRRKLDAFAGRHIPADEEA